MAPFDYYSAQIAEYEKRRAMRTKTTEIVG
jgi:hypothetical protein